MKKDLPSLPLFTDTFIAETTHLNNKQIGIYIRLLCWSWTKKGKAITHEQANIICQCTNDNCRTEVFKILKEFFLFNKKNNDFTSKRIKQEQDYLNDYYEKKSIAGKKGGLARKDFANGKNEPHIPIPIPINKIFNTFWEALIIKKGSKKVAQVRFSKECKGLDPLLLAKLYNSYSSKIPDKQFIQHIATWLSQRRFEDDDLKTMDTGPTLIERMKKLGYSHRGNEGMYEQFSKEGKNYKIHKYNKDAQIELES